MPKLPWRRVGVVFTLIMVLSLILVPAVSASGVAAPTDSAAGRTCSYLVVRGDNLTRIAYRFGVSVYQLMVWNGITNPDHVYWGQWLRVCAPTPPKPPAPKPCVYHCAPPPPPACPSPCAPACPSPCAPACSAPAPGPWNGEYFNNQDLSGGPAFTRQDPAIDFNWGWGSPSSQLICSDHFSARWTGRFNFVCTGNFRFTSVVDDGVRVWVDGNLIMDEWRVQSVRTFTRDVWLDAGGHDVKVEYFEQTGVAEMHLRWSKLP